MTDEQLFRVLRVKESVIELDAVVNDGETISDGAEPPIEITLEGVETDAEPIVSLLEPGHLIRGAVTEGKESLSLTSVEHRGGFTLRRLDHRLIPFPAIDADTTNEAGTRLKQGGGHQIQPLYDGDLWITDESPLGELHLIPEIGDSVPSWEAFERGDSSEAIYGGFASLEGRPAEVFIGNPAASDYWFVILLQEENTELSKNIRTQTGEYFDDRYRVDPALAVENLIDETKIPDELEKNPSDLLDDEYPIRSNHVPDRFGRETTMVIAEFLTVSAQFTHILVDSGTEGFDIDTAIESPPEELNFEAEPIHVVYERYAEPLQTVYERANSDPGFVENGSFVVKKPRVAKLLRYVRQVLEAKIYQIESYLLKLDSVSLDDYVIPDVRGEEPVSRAELREMVGHDMSGINVHIWRVLYDIRFQLDNLKNILRIGDKLTSVRQTDGEWQYVVVRNEKLYAAIEQHQKLVEQKQKPDDLGGEGLSLLLFLIGRLKKRHPWLELGSLGTFGELGDKFATSMRGLGDPEQRPEDQG
jgi:hypothetical protein